MQSTIPDGPQARRVSLIPHVECTTASAGEPCDSQVDWVLTLGGVSDEVLVFDLDPSEPAESLLHRAGRRAA
jgi:hypothetical protein